MWVTIPIIYAELYLVLGLTIKRVDYNWMSIVYAVRSINCLINRPDVLYIDPIAITQYFREGTLICVLLYT